MIWEPLFKRNVLKLSFVAKNIGVEFLGNPNQELIGISSYTNTNTKKISLILEKKYICDSLCEAGAILCSKDFVSQIKNKNLLISENPKLAFAKLSQLFKTDISIPSYNSDLNLFLGVNVSIGQNFTSGVGVIIEDNVVIGDNVTISHNVVIHHGVKIQDNVFIGSGSVIGSEGFGNVLDIESRWNHIAHLGYVLIESNVRLGSNCTIDRGTINDTVIHSGVIIDNSVHIAHNVIIGQNTAIAAKVGIAGSCNIGKRNMIGGMVGIVDHIKTADDVIISATSTVNKDLKKAGRYTGIMPISEHTLWKRIAFWVTKLDKILKKLNFKKI